jgi:hypothetical protein
VSCKGCLAWGVLRRHNQLCWACRWWHTHYAPGQCRYCHREAVIGDAAACRMCLDQARLLQEPGRALDLPGATRHGHQLALANMRFKRFRPPRLEPPPPAPTGPEIRPEGRRVKTGGRVKRSFATPAGFRPVTFRQLALFSADPDPSVVQARALTADGDLVRHCSAVTLEHAAKHGWSERQTNTVLASLRVLQVLQETPGARIHASEVLQVTRYGGTIQSTLEVLADADMLIDDRVSTVERYFADKTAHLPEPMKAQLGVWLQIMIEGSTRAPRRHSRDPATIQVHISGLAPVLTAWAEAGHTSLAEITTEQVREALPASGSRRNFAEYGLRSLFTVLKQRKLVFTDPTRGMRATPVNTNIPLPLDTDAIRAALNSADPAIALAVSLVAFHALTASQVQQLKLTDIVDGRLSLDGRDLPLADPVRTRLSAWLDHRQATWPGSVNPHLFIGRRSAPRLTPAGKQFPWTKTGLRPQALREDRILQEIHATGGDVRRICDLFGLSVQAATRYASTIAHPDLEHPTVRVP